MPTKTDAQLIAELRHQLATARRAYMVTSILFVISLSAILAYGPWAAPRTPEEVCSYEIDVERTDGDGVYPVTLRIREFDNATVTAAYVDPFE